MARTLLLKANVPIHHLGDGILTTFLINRMSSSSLANKIPHLNVFLEVIISHLLMFFCCTWFVHDFSPGTCILYWRTIKSVFLGYSRLLKSYSCYSPVTYQLTSYSLRKPLYFLLPRKISVLLNKSYPFHPSIHPCSLSLLFEKSKITLQLTI